MLTDRRTDGWTEKRMPISHLATSRCDKIHLAIPLVMNEQMNGQMNGKADAYVAKSGGQGDVSCKV